MNISETQLTPDWLSTTAQTKYLELLSKTNGTQKDKALLSLLVDIFSDYANVVMTLRNQGMIVDGRANPLINIKLNLAKSITALLEPLKLKEVSKLDDLKGINAKS